MEDKLISEHYQEIVRVIAEELYKVHSSDTSLFSMERGYCMGVNTLAQKVLDVIMKNEVNNQ